MLVTDEANVLDGDDSQRVTLPVWPLNVNTVEFVPVHTVALPAMVPPTDTGSTVIVTGVVLTDVHDPD